MRRSRLLRPLAVCLSLALMMNAHSVRGGPPGGPDTPTDPNVLWSFVDNISACPAGDSVIAGHPFCVRIAVTYKDADDNPRVGVPPESIWVTYATTSGNARFNDKGAKIYAEDSTNAAGKARIVIRSLSGSGTVRTTLRVANVSQGNKDVHIRTTDPDASGRDSPGSDQTNPGDIDWSGTPTLADSNAAAAHLYHWHRNVLHGTLVQRTSFAASQHTRRGDSRDFWSPSGRYISYTAHIPPDTTRCYVFIVSSDPPPSGSNTPRQVTFGGTADDYDPCWSPLNHTLIHGRGDTTIFARSLIGFGGNGDSSIVARHNDGEQTPHGAVLGTISPDGQWVVFVRRDCNTCAYSLYKIPISGDVTKLKKLTDPEDASDWYPQWTPDQQWIVFQRQPTGQGYSSLYRVRADGDSTQIPVDVYTTSEGKPSAYDAVTPSYSPDGLVFLAGVGPRVVDSMFVHTFDPALSPKLAFPNYAEPRFAAREEGLDFQIPGPILSPDGTRLELSSDQVWAVRRNMNLPPHITSVTWERVPPIVTTVGDTIGIYEADVQVGTGATFQINASDPESDTLYWYGDVMGPGMSFDANTRRLNFGPTTIGFYYGRVRVSQSSGGSDAIIFKLHAYNPVGLSSSVAGAPEERPQPSVGPNPTRESFIFPAPAGYKGVIAASVFDLRGRRLALISGAGTKPLVWGGRGPDGRRAAPGVYLYRIETDEQRYTGKLVIVR